MEESILIPTVRFDHLDIETSALGLGCAPILGRVGARQARRALDLAFASGVRHFDLARSYGYGEAEGLFGQFAHGKRKELTIATKFGIAPSRMITGLNKVKPVARTLFTFMPGLKRHVRSGIAGGLMPAHFSPAEVRRSIENSLRALRTDYVDFLLMHDCQVGGFEVSAIRDFAEEMKRTGKIRAFGLATSLRSTVAILEREILPVNVVQFADNFLIDGARNLPPNAEGVALIRHSPFGARRETIDVDMAATIATLLADAGLDGSAGTLWNDLSLALALRAHPPGIVVCSMYATNHIARNVMIAEGRRFPISVLEAIEGVVAKFRSKLEA